MNDDLLITQRLLRADEVAEILNVSRAYAYQLMQRGKIRTVTFGSARRVRPEDLQMFITESLKPSPNQPTSG